MGKAVSYMLRRCEPLDLFLSAPGAPLDDNVYNQALKRPFTARYSYFFKTEHGAYITGISSWV
jgi:hypothetical protein